MSLRWSGLLCVLVMSLYGFYAVELVAYMDGAFGDAWALRGTLSPDESMYASQAHRALQAAGPAWYELDGFYRPPLASFLYQYLFVVTDFHRIAVLLFNGALYCGALFLIYRAASAALPRAVCVGAVALLAVHPVMIFHVVSFEDTVFAVVSLSAVIAYMARVKWMEQPVSVAFVLSLMLVSLGFRNSNLLALLLLALWSLIYVVNEQCSPNPADERPIPLAMYVVLGVVGLVIALLPHANADWAGKWWLPLGEAGWFVGSKSFRVAVFVCVFAGFVLFVNGVSRRVRFCMASAMLVVGACFHVMCTVIIPLLAFLARDHKGVDLPPLAKNWRSKMCVLLVCAIPLVALNGVMSTVLGENLNWGNLDEHEHRIKIQGYGSENWLNHASFFRFRGDVLHEQYGDHGRDDRYMASFFDRVQTNPAGFVAGLLQKTGRVLSPYEIPRNRSFDFFSEFLDTLRVPYIPVPLLFALGGLSLFVAKTRAARYVVGLLLAVPLAQSALEVVFFNASRYRAIGIPFLVVCSVYGGYRLFEMRGKRRVMAAAAALVLLVIAFLAGNASLDPVTKDKYQSMELYKAARLMLVSDGQVHRAGEFHVDEVRLLESLDEALQLYPGNYEAAILQRLYRMYALNESFEGRSWLACEDGDDVCVQVNEKLTAFFTDPAKARDEINRSMKGRWLFEPVSH